MSQGRQPSRIAVVGLACRYPGADSPGELWRNVLAQRQAFRPLPAERLPPEYLSADTEAGDLSYCRMAAVLENWRFDRQAFGISESTYEATDPAHWLALEVASEALAAAFPGLAGLPRENTGVIVGNTLTGDASRASSLRLRWPYFRRVAAGLELSEEQLRELEARFKAPFAEVGEDTLAGGLANTIAGRVCNHFDFGGGGFTVDGACASSLLAVSQACSALRAGDLEVALAGGVDLSLDPFELVGFARCHAMTAGAMRVYDRRSSGFLPGEGCGFVLLMREEDARARGLEIVATIAGWGVSSDGSGGMTRPEVAGQMLALQRAYKRAGYGADTVCLFEGHGTGTPVGDRVEVEALRRQVGDAGGRHWLGSIKANIGHTKGAAGLAGLLKAIEALEHGAIPPATACGEPIDGLGGSLAIADEPLDWPAGAPRRAGVSAMGFGGINTHVTLEREAPPRKWRRPAGPQDAELFVFCGASEAEVREQIEALRPDAGRLSHADLTDLAIELGEEAGRRRATPGGGSWRCALVAASAEELTRQLAEAEVVGPRGDLSPLPPSPRTERGENQFRGSSVPVVATEDGRNHRLPSGTPPGCGVGASAPLQSSSWSDRSADSSPRIAFLFPGQGSPVVASPGVWARRFPELALADCWLADAPPQAAMVAASLATLRVLRHLGIEAEAGLGHSLGELAALCWAGALDERSAVELAAARAEAMRTAAEATGDGAMMALACGSAEARDLLAAAGQGPNLVVAALNSSRQTVLSGPRPAALAAAALARARGIAATVLPTSAAFHSPAMAGAAPAYGAALAATRFAPVEKPVFSTIAGRRLEKGEPLAPLLLRQLTEPVLFAPAREALEADLLIEVGAGEVLAQLAGGVAARLDPFSLRGLLEVAAAFWLAGGELDLDALAADRTRRPFGLGRPRVFLASPCERVAAPRRPGHAAIAALPAGASAELTLRHLLAEQTRLPFDSITGASRLSADLHLSSITVARLLAEAARQLGAPPLLDAMALAGASVAAAAAALELARREPAAAETKSDALTPGIGPWVRVFERTFAAAAPPPARPSAPGGWRFFGRRMPGWPERFATVPGRGLVWLAPEEGEAAVASLLELARAAADGERLVVVQDRPLAGGFARSLFLERPALELAIVQIEKWDEAGLEQAAAESAAGYGCGEAAWRGGRRFEPSFRLLPAATAPAERLLGPEDVLLVSGGAKGIGFETALHLVRRSGAACILLGRSPRSEAEVEANLARLEGHRWSYIEGADVRLPLALGGSELGAVTAILHAAGVNQPALAESLDVETVLDLVAIKSGGLHHLLEAVDLGRLKLLLTFGSVIAESGLRGEAHYALANEWLARDTEEFARRNPACRTLCLEYSVWAGGGMGARLGAVEALRRQGVMPMAEADALAATVEQLERAEGPVRRVVCGRLGELPTLAFAGEQLPLLRFLEKIRVHVPGVELVADAELSTQSDPYLEEHVYEGAPLLPAVVGLEAMAQAFKALTGEAPRRIENVELRQPLFVTSDQGATLRVAALAGEEQVEIVLRGGASEFLFDNFRARFPRLSGTPPGCGEGEAEGRSPSINLGHPPLRPRRGGQGGEVPSGPATEAEVAAFYDQLLFHHGRFRRVHRYLELSARALVAELGPSAGSPAYFFHRWAPQELLLGDPGLRDAAIHALQAAIPQAVVLPAGIAAVELFVPLTGELRLEARETGAEGDELFWDLELYGDGDRLCERWRGLRLKLVSRRPSFDALPASLWGPLLERELGLPVVLGELPTDEALRRAGGGGAPPIRRADGKPLAVQNGLHLSASSEGRLSLAVADSLPVGCDLQRIGGQPWHEILTLSDRLLAELCGKMAGDPFPLAAARVWAARESCFKRSGDSLLPLVLSSLGPEPRTRRLTFDSGGTRVETFAIGDEHVAAVARGHQP
jgi:enediyne polyketide synthase